MPRSCPPGVICIENINIVFIFLLILGIIYYFYNNIITQVRSISTPQRDNTIIINRQDERGLFNPYKPPLKDNVYIQHQPIGIPINISTQGRETNYKQVGILTRIAGPETILPLMGRPLITNRDKWQYYTISNTNNSVRLPIVNNGKSCTGEYGCNDLYNGDTVYVEGYNDAFKITIYENSSPKYIPYI